MFYFTVHFLACAAAVAYSDTEVCRSELVRMQLYSDNGAYSDMRPTS